MKCSVRTGSGKQCENPAYYIVNALNAKTPMCKRHAQETENKMHRVNQPCNFENVPKEESKQWR